MKRAKIAIIGASHGGHQSLLELLSCYGENVDITLFESGDFISFMSCGMQLYLENKVTDVMDVRNFRLENFRQSNVSILNNHQVIGIDATNKSLTVIDTTTNKELVYDYDKLILSPGVTPKSLPIPGGDLENIFLMRGYDWATKIKQQLSDDSIKEVTIIGAGYIGIEAAEVSKKCGKNVTIIDIIDRPLGTYLNSELTDILEKHLIKNEINVITSAKIKKFIGSNKIESVELADQTISSDLVIEATGIQANTDWLKGTIELDDRGWIKTDEYLQTNIPDVYAIGDATLAYSIPAKQQMPIALATVARREARYVVRNLFNDIPDRPFKGVIGSSALSVFDYHFAASGLNSFTAEKANVPVSSSFYHDTLRPKYVSKKFGNTDAYIQLFFDPKTHQILGGAVLSTHDITAQGNVIALAVQHLLTLEDLAEADFFFQPGFDRQWSLLNLAAQHALGEHPLIE